MAKKKLRRKIALDKEVSLFMHWNIFVVLSMGTGGGIFDLPHLIMIGCGWASKKKSVLALPGRFSLLVLSGGTWVAIFDFPNS